jgi:hypothetical protein
VNTKTVLIVAGVGVGAFVLLKLLVPPAPARARVSSSVSPGTSLQGLIAGFGALVGSTSSSDARPGTYYPTVNTTDTASQQSYAIRHDVVDLEGNQLIDLNTGNALVYGP